MPPFPAATKKQPGMVGYIGTLASHAGRVCEIILDIPIGIVYLNTVTADSLRQGGPLRNLDANTISDRIKEMNASAVDKTGEFQLRGQQKKFAEAIHLLTIEIFRTMPDEQRASILQSLPAEMQDALATLAALKDVKMPPVAREKRAGRRKATDAKSA